MKIKNYFQNLINDFKKKKFLSLLGLIILVFIIAGNVVALSAFEAYVVNVTAKICNYAETRTMGYWKNHENIYGLYLPVWIGNEELATLEQVDNIFKNAKAKVMRNMLKAQLLGMKFNILAFGIGDYYVESEGKNLNAIVNEADDLLKQDPEPAREVLENMKNILDNLNNLHQIKYCSDTSGWVEFIESTPQPSPDLPAETLVEEGAMAGTPTPTPEPSVEPTPTPSPTIEPTPTPTPSETPTPTPAPSESPTPTPTPLVSPTPIPTPTPEPTPEIPEE